MCILRATLWIILNAQIHVENCLLFGSSKDSGSNPGNSCSNTEVQLTSSLSSYERETRHPPPHDLEGQELREAEENAYSDI